MVARHCQCEGLVADAVAGERQLGEQQHLGTAGPGGGDHLQMFRQIGGDVAMTRLDLRDGEFQPASLLCTVLHRQSPSSRPPTVRRGRSEEHTSELQSLMRISYAVFCLKKKQTNTIYKTSHALE